MSEETKEVGENRETETIQTEIKQEPVKQVSVEKEKMAEERVLSESNVEEEKSEPVQKKAWLHSKKKVAVSREEQILSRIRDEDVMKYLEMEQKRIELTQSIKESREKRIFTMLQLLISLAAIVSVVFLLRDNPTVLVNILYIIGIIIVLWILKNPQDKHPFRKE